MRKFITVFIAVILFYSSTLAIPYINSAEAAYSKVATQAAKKVAKEAISDMAVTMAEDIIFHYQMEQWLSGKYDVEEGYKPVCLDKKTGNQNTGCKTAQIKELDKNDKKVLSNKVEEVLERKAGMSGWQKFLDFFVPLFLINTAVSWIVTKLDSATEDLFDQVAKESLQETGFMKPLPLKNSDDVVNEDGSEIIYPDTTPVESNDSLIEIPDITIANEVKFVNTGKTSSQFNYNVGELLSSVTYHQFFRDITTADPLYNTDSIYMNVNGIVYSVFGITEKNISAGTLTGTSTNTAHLGNTVKVYKNGEYVNGSYTGAQTIKVSISEKIDLDNISSIRVYPVRTVDGITAKPYRFDALPSAKYAFGLIEFNVGNDLYKVYVTTYFEDSIYPNKITNVKYLETHTENVATQLSVKAYTLTNIKHVVNENYTPTIEDILLDSFEGSNYQNNGSISILPPVSVPIFTPDGEQVTPDGEGGWKDVTTGDKVEVNEDELIVKDPEKTEDEDGFLVPGSDPITKPELDTDTNPDTDPDKAPVDDSTGTGSDLDQLGDNLPKELILALLDTLRAILYYMVRLATFILSIPTIPIKPIPYESLQWFFNVEILGVQIVNLVRTLALTGLSFGIFKILKKVF